MNIPFCGPTYQGRSSNISSSRCVNLYPEITDEIGGKSQIALIGTPGLQIFSLSIDFSANSVRGLFASNNQRYAVVSNGFYSVDSSGVGTKRGTLTTSSGRVDFSDNGAANNGVGGDQIIIIDGENGYIYNITTAVFTTISGGGWVDLLLSGGPKQVEYLDGYFIVTNQTMKSWSSDLYDGLTWNALATAAITATADPIQSLVNHRQQIFFIKEFSTEVWYDAGTPTSSGFPFSRVSGAVYDYGTVAPWSIAKGGASFYFLCTQRTADGAEMFGVAEVTEYSPVIISTPAINWKISQSTNFSNCFGYCYSEQGHMFYVLTNPTDDWTVVYDANTKMWHERSSVMVDSITTHRHLGNCYMFCDNKHYVGDYRNSNVYEMSSSYLTDNGLPIWSYRTSQIIQDPNMRNNVFIYRLIVDAEAGMGTDTPVVLITTPVKAGYDGPSTDALIGTYNGATAYVVGNIVLYSGNYYRCIQNGTGQQPDTKPLYWSTPIPNVLVLADGGITAGAYSTGVSNPLAYLSWSNDAGRTWGTEYPCSLGTEGAYTQRLIWRRLGKARDRVFKLRISEAVNKVIIGAYVEAGL